VTILQIYREPVKPGSEAAYRAIEDETARACAELKCPHPHLAMEPLAGPREVWWLNTFASEEERQPVIRDYERNDALMAVLRRSNQRKAGVTGAGTERFLAYRQDLSRGVSWSPAGARFIVVTVTRRDRLPEGAVFEGGDGMRFVLRPAATRDEAEIVAEAAAGETTVFAVRPYWGMPAKEWIAADPEFWQANPVAGRG
jgi:hypothetical protein